MSVPLVAASGIDGMRYLESLMDEVGVRSASSSSMIAPSTVATASGGKNGASATKPLGSLHIRDCLEPVTRGGQQSQSKLDMSSVRRSPSPSTMMQKGALMLGKGEDDESRYFGKSYALAGRSESPGPIYDPPLSTFFPNNGVSFSRAPKRTMETMSVGSMQSELVLLPGSIGKQVESSFSNASSASFPRGSRFNARQFISRVHDDGKGMDSPSPTAYQPSEGASTNDGRGAVMCGGRVSTAKLFLSRAHTADCIGVESPGPIYNPQDGSKLTKAGLPHPFDRPTSNAACGPSVSFSGSRASPSAAAAMNDAINVQPTNPTCRCHVSTDDSGKWKRTCVHSTAKPGGISKYVAQEPFISHQHSKVQSTANTPGPAYYTPAESHTFLETGPQVSFTKAKLSAGTEAASSASPGPKYNPSDAYVSKNRGSVTFGSKYPHEDRIDRFSGKQFFGKAFGSGVGTHSPGPIYDPKDTRPEAPAVTIAFKEKVYKKKPLFPGPTRNRYESKESARENFGIYSPGPKYDTRGDISREGVSFSIPQSAKLGQRPRSAQETAAAGDDDLDGVKKVVRPKSKQSKPTLLHPKDDYLSTTVAGPAICISPKPTSVARKRPESPHEVTAASRGAEAEAVNFSLVETAYPAVSFSKNSRLPPTRLLLQPGPTQYTPNFIHVERSAPSVSIGVL